jgi:hypothetical protein
MKFLRKNKGGGTFLLLNGAKMTGARSPLKSGHPIMRKEDGA